MAKKRLAWLDENSYEFTCCAKPDPDTTENYIATGSGNGRVCVWDTRKQGKPVVSQKVHQGTVWDIDFVPKTSYAISSGEDGSICSIDLTNFCCDSPDAKTLNEAKKAPRVNKLRQNDELPYTCVSIDEQPGRMLVASEGGLLQFFTWSDPIQRQLVTMVPTYMETSSRPAYMETSAIIPANMETSEEDALFARIDDMDY